MSAEIWVQVLNFLNIYSMTLSFCNKRWIYLERFFFCTLKGVASKCGRLCIANIVSLVIVANQMQQYLLHCHVFDQAEIMFEVKGAHIKFLLFTNCAYNSLTEAEQFGTLMFNMKILIKSLMWNPHSRFFKSIQGLHTFFSVCTYLAWV